MLTSASRSQLTFRVATSVCSMPEADKADITMYQSTRSKPVC